MRYDNGQRTASRRMADGSTVTVAGINAKREKLTEQIHLAQHRGETAKAEKLIEERTKLTEQVVG